MRRRFALLGLALLCGCGDLEASRICLNPPCRVPGKPTPACEAYVACYYRGGGSPGSLDSSYGRGGTCWTSGEAVVDACDMACKSAMTISLDGGC